MGTSRARAPRRRAGGDALRDARRREYRHVTIELFGDPAYRGRGPETIEALVAHLAGERGHHRIAIDPALANEAAILAYEKAGFRRVGVIEAYWLDHVTGDWSDGLLMERMIRG